MNTFGHLRIWLGLLVVLIVALPALMDADSIARRVNGELEQAQDAFGIERTQRVYERANSAWAAIVVRTGVRSALEAAPERRTDNAVRNVITKTQHTLYSTTQRYLKAVSMQMYAVFLRGAILMEWLMFIGFFLVAAVVDGIARRRVKMATGGLASPVKFSWSTHWMLAIAMSPFIYILLPFEITPLFMPVWTLVVALPLSAAIANAVRIQ
jgi:hypothetical protein